MQKLSGEQAAWLCDDRKSEFLTSFEDWARSRDVRDRRAAFEQYLGEWESKLANGPTIISLSVGPEDLFEAIRAKIQQIDTFGINIRHGFKAQIRDKRLQSFDIQGSAQLQFQNCAIKEINCRDRDGASSSLTLIDCWIGNFNIGPKSLRYLEMKGGGVKRLQTPLPGEGNPFVGSVSIVSPVKFSPDIENAQAFRNLRHHLASIHNLEAASVFHSAEMRTLYKEQNGLDKLFNLTYRIFSDYGNSTIRPFILFLFFAAVNCLIFSLRMALWLAQL